MSSTRSTRRSDAAKDAGAKRGGLPEDEGLDAFAAAAAGAFAAPPTRRRRGGAAPAGPGAGPGAGEMPPAESASVAVPAAVPVAAQADVSPEQPPVVSAPAPRSEPPVTWVEPVPVAPVPAVPAGAEPVTVALRVPQLGESGQEATQCTIMVSSQVRKRFAAYQLAQKVSAGHEPTNAVVVRRAVIHAKKHDLFVALLEAVRHRQQPVQEEDFDPDNLFGEVPARRTERGAVKDGRQQSFRPSKQELAVIDSFTAAYGFPNRSDFLNGALDAFLPPLPEGGRARSR